MGIANQTAIYRVRLCMSLDHQSCGGIGHVHTDRSYLERKYRKSESIDLWGVAELSRVTVRSAIWKDKRKWSHLQWTVVRGRQVTLCCKVVPVLHGKT